VFAEVSLIVLRIVLFFAALGMFGVLGAILSPNGAVHAFPNAVSVTVDSSGVVTVRYQVTSRGGTATLDAQLSGGSGSFVSANAVVGNNGTCAPAGIGSIQLRYTCLDSVDTGSGTLPETTAIFQCTSSSQVSFRLTQGTDVRTTASVPCGTSSTSSGPIFVTATPNVVPCGGRTLITANIRDTSGNIVSNAVFHFDTDQGLLDPSGTNTAVLTVYPGMTSARVRASAAGFGTNFGDVLVQVFCPTPTAPSSSSLGSNSQGTPIAAQPAAATSITLTANPGAVERCGGTVFVVAAIKDAAGRPAADGTTVLFIASGGTISTDSATTVAGTATITFTADRTMTGSVKISGQAGAAFASVNIPIACTATEAIRAAAGTPIRPSSATSSTDSSSGNGTGPTGSSSSIPPPLSSGPRIGDLGSDLSGIIRPPSTGQAGLASDSQRCSESC
jgi:hypothetical protein